MTDGEENAVDKDMRVTEYHMIAGRGRTARCVSFTSLTAKDTKTGIHKMKTKRKDRGYFDVSSVLDESNETNRNRNRNRNRNAQNSEADDDATDEPETPVPSQINYQVLHPSPVDSYTSHYHKYINYYANDKYWYGNSRNPRRRRAKLAKLARECLVVMDDDIMTDNEEVDNEIEESGKGMTNIEIDLTDLLDKRKEHETQSRKKVKTKLTNKCNFGEETNQNKTHIIYIEPEETSSPNALGANRLEGHDIPVFDLKETTPSKALEADEQKYTIVEPARVILSSKEIAPDRLREKFSNRYIECDCHPRKFVIDISEEIGESGTDKPGLTYACLVFVKEKEGSTYSLYFNMRFDKNIDYVNVFALYHYTVTVTTIDKVIQKAIFYGRTYDSNIVKDKKNHFRNAMQRSKTTLEQLANWGSSAYLPNLKDLFNDFVQTHESPEPDKDVDFEMVSVAESGPVIDKTDSDESCAICFSDISDPVPATALRACGHWFCDTCWKEHLITCVRDGRLNFVCPEYDCDQSVDRGTLLSLLNMKHVLLYLRRRHDNDVELMKDANWCPNSSCGRVVKVNSEDAKVAACTCGKKYCFACQTDVHWPAKCSDVHDYRKKLQENGDDKIVPVVITEPFTVNGRNCPICKRFVVKNGGCPYMTCICRHNFCWGCGIQWSLRSHGVECYKSGTLNSHKGTKDITVKEEISKLARNKLVSKWYRNANWYKIAVDHRTRGQLITQPKLLDSVRKLGPKLSRHVSKSNRNNSPVSFDIVVPNKTFSCEAAMAGDFLKDTMALFSEIHQIIEHVAIHLDSTSVEKTDVISIQNTVNKMAILSDSIYDLLLNGHSMDERYVFDKLKENRQRSKKFIKGLVRYFNSV